MKEAKKPLILLSNDDGFDATGIGALIKILRPIGDIIVVAPEGGRSGSSLSITGTVPVKYNTEYEEEGGKEGSDFGSLTVYSCSGTPCDCVKMALEFLMPRRPDIVIGGINHGDNAATNAHYSGTIGIAIEGTLKSIPSVGFSSCAFSNEEDFLRLDKHICHIVKNVLKNGLPEKVFLNVNFPDHFPFKGTRICRMGMGDWVDEWIERDHPRGGKYFWIAGSFKSFDGHDETTDIWALNNGFVAITPITLDFTAYESFQFLKDNGFEG